MLAAVPASRPRPARPARAAAAGAALAALAVVAAAGCASFDATFGKQEAVVRFRPHTAEAVQLKVRAACSHLPRARPEPVPTDPVAAGSGYEVRYRVDSASDADLARLQQCLQRFPAVVGIEFSGPGGS